MQLGHVRGRMYVSETRTFTRETYYVFLPKRKLPLCTSKTSTGGETPLLPPN